MKEESGTKRKEKRKERLKIMAIATLITMFLSILMVLPENTDPPTTPTPYTMQPSPTQTAKFPIAVSELKLNKNSVNLREEGEIKLGLIISPPNATNQQVEWTTSNNKAKVINGIVKARKSGKVTIMVTSIDGNKKARCEIKIKKKLIKVPNVLKLRKGIAEKKLLDCGLTVKTFYNYSRLVASGKVISQKKKAGRKVERGSRIILKVSKGAQPTPTPRPTLRPTSTPRPTPRPTPPPPKWTMAISPTPKKSPTPKPKWTMAPH